MINELNKRLTKIHDEYLKDKAEQNRLKRITNKKEEEAIRLDMELKFGHKGPYSMTELFKYMYRDFIVDMKPDNSFLNKVKKNDNWKGGSISLPFKENK